MNTDNPLVSILVPCYNHEKYIDDCLNSIINQTYDNIELLIIDDCSTDRSYNILKEWEDKLRNRFSKIVIERNTENLGVVKTLNKMIKISRGEYIKILASDDMLTTNAIKEMINFALVNKADLFFANAITVSNEAKYKDYYNRENIEKLGTTIYPDKPKDGIKLTKYLLNDFYICAPTIFIPKETFNNIGLFNEKYIMEDFDFVLRVSESSEIKYIDEVVALYRDNDNSLSRNRGKIYNERFIQFVLDKKDIFDSYATYVDKEIIRYYYNVKILGQLSDANDRNAFCKVIEEMRKRDIDISLINRIKLILFKLRLHSVYKKAVRVLYD